jgi:hypothetical protein
MQSLDLPVESLHPFEDLIEGSANVIIAFHHAFVDFLAHAMGVLAEVIHALLDTIPNHVRHLLETFVHEPMHVFHHAVLALIHPALHLLFHRAMVIPSVVVCE